MESRRMNKSIYFAVTAIVLLQFTCGRVIRDAPTSNTEESVKLRDVAAKAENALQDLAKHFYGFVGVKDETEFRKVFDDQAKLFVSKLDVLAQDIKKQAEIHADTIENSEAVKNLRSSVDDAINSWKSQNPSTAADFEKFKDQVTKTSQSLFKEMNALGDSEGAKKLKELSAQVLETTADTLNNVRKNINPTPDN